MWLSEGQLHCPNFSRTLGTPVGLAEDQTFWMLVHINFRIKNLFCNRNKHQHSSTTKAKTQQKTPQTCFLELCHIQHRDICATPVSWEHNTLCGHDRNVVTLRQPKHGLLNCANIQRHNRKQPEPEQAEHTHLNFVPHTFFCSCSVICPKGRRRECSEHDN